VRVGARSFVGANAVVAKDLPDGAIYTPGREIAALRRRVEELERALEDLKGELAAAHEARPERPASR
jgi:serine acetyltransferase